MSAKRADFNKVIGEDEIDLRRLLGIFWRRRLLVSLAAGFFAAVALTLAFVIPKRYTASTLLMPAEGNSRGLGGLSSLVSQYSGLASLAGISASSSDKSQEYLALLQSTLITEKFIHQYNLLPVLYLSRWDTVERHWRQGVRIPTLWEGSQYFQKKIMNVTKDSETGLVTLAITWKNPHLAANWANSLVRLTNEYAQRKAIDKAKREIAFLNGQATKTKYVQERQDVFSIMHDELTKEMIAKGNDDYALKVIDPAFAPEKATFPKPILWTLLGLLVGIVFGCGYALMSHPTPESKHMVDREGLSRS